MRRRVGTGLVSAPIAGLPCTKPGDVVVRPITTSAVPAEQQAQQPHVPVSGDVDSVSSTSPVEQCACGCAVCHQKITDMQNQLYKGYQLVQEGQTASNALSAWSTSGASVAGGVDDEYDMMKDRPFQATNDDLKTQGNLLAQYSSKYTPAQLKDLLTGWVLAKNHGMAGTAMWTGDRINSDRGEAIAEMIATGYPNPDIPGGGPFAQFYPVKAYKGVPLSRSSAYAMLENVLPHLEKIIQQDHVRDDKKHMKAIQEAIELVLSTTGENSAEDFWQKHPALLAAFKSDHTTTDTPPARSENYTPQGSAKPCGGGQYTTGSDIGSDSGDSGSDSGSDNGDSNSEGSGYHSGHSSRHTQYADHSTGFGKAW